MTRFGLILIVEPTISLEPSIPTLNIVLVYNLGFIHSLDVLQSNMRKENILVREDNSIAVIDFE